MSNVLPGSWAWVRVDDVIEKVSITGKKLKQSEYQERGVFPVIDQGQLFIGGYTDRSELKAQCGLPVIIFGDHTKQIKYVNFGFVAGADGIKILKPQKMFSPKLFYYFLQVVELPDKGYARHFQFLEKSLIPLPPLNEQKRIVAKVEALFTKLDAGVDALKKVKAQLKRYRQAVLKYAMEGKLTEEWRKENKIKEKWAGTTVENIGTIVTGTTPSKENDEYYGSDHPFFKPTDLNAGYYTRKSADGLSKQGIKKARMLPCKSILVTCIGATIGKTGFTRVEGTSNQQINAIVPFKNISPEFVYFVAISQAFQKSISESASATTLPILNKSKFGILPFPLPPLSEQEEIVKEVERRFSVAEEVEKIVEQSLKQAERLRQSILKRAFEGKLVPQNPNDEPAEKLLERIKAEKEKADSQKKRKAIQP